MPRRHKREKQKQKSLPLKIQRRKEKKQEEKERMLLIDPVEKQGELVCGIMYPGNSYTLKFDKDLGCLLAFDENGIVAHSFTESEMFRKWKWYTGRSLAKHELVQEIIDAFEDMPIQGLYETLEQLRPRDKKE